MLGVLGRWLNPINPKLDVKYKKTIPFSMKPYVLYPYYHAIKEGVNERLKPALPPLDRVQVLYPLGRASSVTTSVTTPVTTPVTTSVATARCSTSGAS
jgi:hypothetical protein